MGSRAWFFVVASGVGLLGLPMGDARAVAAGGDDGAWWGAIADAFVLIDVSNGDLDGDGKDETVACYRKDRGGVPYGGVVVLKGRAPNMEPVFHAQLRARCEKVRVAKGKLGLLLEGAQQLVWKNGDDIKLRDARGSFPSQIVAKASSSKPGHAPAKALDGDLSTSWAEAAAGTGIGQTLTLRLPRPTDVGTVGIACGDGASTRGFFDNNRVHRGSLEARTEADLGDADAGVDFSALGIESVGDRIEFRCENRPGITYVNVGKRDIVELQVRIDSVYLGDKHDDTHIAEVEVVPVLTDAETIDKAKPVKKGAKGGKDKGAKSGDDGKGKGAKDATEKLDAESGLIDDDL
jgi:hypothetical protein